MTDSNHARHIGSQMRALINLARAHDLHEAAEWIEDRFPSGARRNGGFNRILVDQILAEEVPRIGQPDA